MSNILPTILWRGMLLLMMSAFSIDEGSLVGILGASGSGKTTLLNLMSGIETTCGTVKINGWMLSKTVQLLREFLVMFLRMIC